MNDFVKLISVNYTRYANSNYQYKSNYKDDQLNIFLFSLHYPLTFFKISFSISFIFT